jgi:hypothetical protein
MDGEMNGGQQFNQENNVEQVSSEERAKDLANEVVRLRFDTNDPEVPNPNFDNDTGENLKDNPLKKAESVFKTMVKRAERDLRKALGYDTYDKDAKFSGITGKKIPEIELDQSGNPTPESLSTRVKFFREDVGVIVNDAVTKRGIQIANFDGTTGERIPKDSLRALNEVRNIEAKPRQLTEAEEDEQDAALGMKLLAEMKRIKTEDAIKRSQAGLPPEN